MTQRNPKWINSLSAGRWINNVTGCTKERHTLFFVSLADIISMIYTNTLCMNGWKTRPRRLSLSFPCTLGITQVKSIKRQTYVQNKLVFLYFVFLFLSLIIWSEISLKKHPTSLGVPTGSQCNDVKLEHNKVLRNKTTRQLMTTKITESSGNGKSAETFGKSVFFLYCLYCTLPSETLISDTLSL